MIDVVHLAIDLGSSTTMAARVDSKREPQVLPIDCDLKVPSVIVIPSGELSVPIVGKVAERLWSQGSPTGFCFRRWKMHMGQAELVGTPLGSGAGPGPTLTPARLTTAMVKHILDRVSSGLGGERVETLQVTVPHGWRRDHPDWCTMVRDAAAAARLDGQAISVRENTVSEPVAAAAYWIWEASKRRPTLFDEIKGRHILVCDMGGGTFDLSVVHVKDRSLLVVVDAANADSAGDFATAILCASMGVVVNAAEGVTTNPVQPDQVLGLLASPQHAWLRDWFSGAEILLQRFSLRDAFTRQLQHGLQKPISITHTFTSSTGRSHSLDIDVEVLKRLLDPFYRRIYDHLQGFLGRLDRNRLAGILFAGGGTRIIGVQETAHSVLRQVLPLEQAEQVISKVPVNSERIDQAVVLGAALITQGEVDVRERLLYQVGLQVKVHGEVAKSLGCKEGEYVIVSPIVPRLCELPTAFDGAGLGFHFDHGRSLSLTLVLDDEADASRVMEWHQVYPWPEGQTDVTVGLRVDGNGNLSLEVAPASGHAIHVEGNLLKAADGASRAGMRRVDLDAFRKALTRPGGSPPAGR